MKILVNVMNCGIICSKEASIFAFYSSNIRNNNNALEKKVFISYNCHIFISYELRGRRNFHGICARVGFPCQMFALSGAFEFILAPVVDISFISYQSMMTCNLHCFIVAINTSAAIQNLFLDNHTVHIEQHIIVLFYWWIHNDGLKQEIRNSSALAIELRFFFH